MGIDDVEWKMLVDVAFDIYWKGRRLLRPLTPEEKANLLNLIRIDRRISHPLTIGVLPDGRRFLADGHHRLEIWLEYEHQHGWPKPQFEDHPASRRDRAIGATWTCVVHRRMLTLSATERAQLDVLRGLIQQGQLAIDAAGWLTQVAPKPPPQGTPLPCTTIFSASISPA